jgi:predicted Rossmann fold nucleotide-binding protein DprA/Smf involved in DNA uptake
MSRRSDAELASLLLTQRLVDSGATPLKGAEFWSLIERTGDLGALVGQRAARIAELTGLDDDASGRIETLLGAATAFAFALDDAEQTGMRLLSGTDEDYPQTLTERLGAAAPPILYVLGDVALLHRPGLGIVGSRSVSAEGAQVARDAATAAVEHGLGVISGGAKGVDRLAMGAALDANGHAVGVLADSLLRTARDAEVRRAIGDGTLCLCSPYKPTAGFGVANAMGRNKLIYALSAATLVAECEEESGGTWAGAVEALGRAITSVIVWTGGGASIGNKELARRGAIGLDDLQRLFPLPHAPARAGSAAQQLALGL